MYTTLRRAFTLSLIAGGAFTQAIAQEVKFSLPPRDFRAIESLANIVVGDFNNDGVPDVVTIDNDNHASIFIGSGMGSLGQPRLLGLAGPSLYAAAGDVNGDGKLDLIYSVPSGIAVLLGNGDGTFTQAGDFNAGLCCGSITVGDFNGDGKLDVVGLHVTTGASLFLGNGDGTFQNAQFIATPVQGQPYSAYTADVNGDGRADLLIRAASGQSGSTILVYLANAAGGFAAALKTTLSVYAIDLAVGDFNGDGKADLGITSSTCCSASVGVLLGNGDGTFQTPQLSNVSTAPIYLKTGDFNHDGKLDLVGGTNQSGVVMVFLGSGDGAIGAPSSIAVGGGGPVAVGEFNDNHNLDIVCGNSDSISLLLGKGDGSFYQFRRYSPGSDTYSKAMALGDMNGDGRLDIVTANGAGTASVLLNNGDATFQTAITSASQYKPFAIALGDFNGDGKLDAATVGGGVHGSVNVLLGNGDGSFQAPAVIVAGSYPNDLVSADVNGDGKLDLLLANGGSESVSVLLGKGDGTFQSPVPYRTGSRPTSLAVGDMDADGNPDIVTTDQQGNTVSISFGNGDGTFQNPVQTVVPDGPSAITLADLNNDGLPDVIVINAIEVAVLLNMGNGNLQAPVFYNTGSTLRALTVADLNGDGILDVIGVKVVNEVVALLGKGDGTLILPRSYYGTPEYPFSVAAGDLNGDGKLDLAVASQASVEVMVNTTP